MALKRSSLTVPGSNLKMMSKAIQSDADIVILDLEDSVPLDLKIEARDYVIEALTNMEFQTSGRMLRINAVSTSFAYGDLVAAVEGGADGVVIPKVNSTDEIHFVDHLLSSLENFYGKTDRLIIQPLIESTSGLLELANIVCASARINSIVFGIGDYLAELGARFEKYDDTLAIGILNWMRS